MKKAVDADRAEFDSEQAFLLHAARCLAVMRDVANELPHSGADKKASAALGRMAAETLTRMSRDRTICIGRIDLDDGDIFHVGPQVVWDGLKPVVISWAAPIAAPFYTATPTDPQGLVKRRRLQTDYDRLLGLSDETLLVADVSTPPGIDSVEVAAGTEPALNDLMLDELGRDRTGVMRQIVSTIQRDQYEIISCPAGSTTVVQGAPGTGKTVVGLHRAALLLFRNRESDTGQRILIVGPNPLFIRYISHVLPSLGETAADQVAAADLGTIRTRRSDDPMVARVKGSPSMKAVVANAVADRIRPPSEGIVFRTPTVEFEVGPEAVADAVSTARSETSTYNSGRERFRAALERLAMRAWTRTQADVRPPDFRVRSMPEFERAVDRIWPSITAAELIRQLLSSEDRLERAASDGVLTAAERRLLYRRPVASVDEVEWTTSDVPLVDEARFLLEGPPPRYWHVILDEVQDLTPMELRMVGRRMLANAATVLGDLAQATGSWRYERWSEVLEHLGVAEADAVKELRFAYRVPSEIMRMALPILKLTAPTVAAPIPYRTGGIASCIQVESSDRAAKALTVAADSGAAGTTALIAPYGLLPNLRAEFDARAVQYGDAERNESLDHPIELLDPIMAKGLEFDNVVVVEPAALIREARSGQGYKELYVALTRPTRSLTVIHSEALPWPLGDLMDGNEPALAVNDTEHHRMSETERLRAELAAELMKGGTSPADAREYAVLVYPDR